MEDDVSPPRLCSKLAEFQSTSSVWRTTRAARVPWEKLKISIHVLRMEDDARPLTHNSAISRFQSTSSVWRTTEAAESATAKRGDFNPRPPYGGRHLNGFLLKSAEDISIHVLRMEDDFLPAGLLVPLLNFNPRPPYGGRPVQLHAVGAVMPISIHVLRMEDDAKTGCTSGGTDISIHVLRMEDDPGARCPAPSISRFQSTSSVWRTTSSVSTATARAAAFQSTSSVWRTTTKRAQILYSYQFQSTSSVWRTTLVSIINGIVVCISIHVLRMEDDSMIDCNSLGIADFNPRPPYGGRQLLENSASPKWVFQSTSSVWRTTADITPSKYVICISIHVLRMEDDQPCVAML